MAPRLAIVIAVLVFVSSCQLPGSQPTCNAMIDWVNFVEVGSTQYVAGPEPLTVLQPNDLGPVYARVKFRVDGNVCDPNYRVKNGDAAFLEPGTAIYQVPGHSPTEQLAAQFNGRILVYRALAPAP